MIHSILSHPPYDGLTKLGEPEPLSKNWLKGEPNYIEELGFTHEHIPYLIEIVRSWAFDEVNQDEQGDAVFAPLYAWRILGQLRAIEAVDPMLEMLERLEELHDDFALEEFPDVFGLIGEGAIPSLVGYIQTRDYEETNRICAIEALQKVAEYHPECRDVVLEHIVAELERMDASQQDVNGFLVWALMDLNAVEHAELIERAFAADCVEPSICGRWGDVRLAMGVEGMGLAPDITLKDLPAPWVQRQRELMGESAMNRPITSTERNKAKRQRQNLKKKKRKR